MKVDKLNVMVWMMSVLLFTVTIVSCSSDDDDMNEPDDMMEEECDLMRWYEDMDADMFGNISVFIDSCDQPLGFVLDSTDLNDQDDFFNFTFTFNEPSASEYKIGEVLPINISFGSRTGDRALGRVRYTIRRADNGTELLTRSSNVQGGTSFNMANDIFELTSTLLDGDVNVPIEIEAQAISPFNSGETSSSIFITAVE